MREFLQFLGWASGSMCAALLAGVYLATPAQALAIPKVSDCTTQCGCSNVTNDCYGTTVTGCKDTCDCTGLNTPACGFQ
jgi:hypothetical protein